MTEKQKHPVLLVDDEPDILFSLKGLLRRDFEVYTAQTAKEAVEILAAHPIHVVMTDQRMPEMTGVELLGAVRDQYPEAVRIIFTGYADIKAVVDAINSGGLYRYITKPWDPDELIELLHGAAATYEQFVERKQLLGELRNYLALEPLSAAAEPAANAQERETRRLQLLERLDQFMLRESQLR